jgi:Clostripain family
MRLNVILFAKGDFDLATDAACTRYVLKPLLCDAKELSKKVNLRVQMSRFTETYTYAKLGGISGVYAVEEKYWEGTRSFDLSAATTVDEIKESPSPQHSDMSSPKSLRSFVTSPAITVPTVLVLWGHGGAWATALQEIGLETAVKRHCPEAQEPLKRLLVRGLGDALDGVKNIDSIVFVSCYMGSLEVAYELKSAAKTLVASVDSVFADTLPISDLIHRTASDHSIKGVVTAYASLIEANRPDRISILGVALGEINALVTALNSWIDVVMKNNNSRPLLQTVRSKCHTYQPVECFGLHVVNLRQFFELSQADEILKDPAKPVLLALERAVPEHRTSADWMEKSGVTSLTIYFPERKSTHDDLVVGHIYEKGQKSTPRFVDDSKWREFLDWFWKPVG